MLKLKLNPDQYPLITPDSDWQLPTELPDLRRAGEIALDTETRDNGILSKLGPGWACGLGYVAGVGVAWDGGKIYIPIRHPETANFPKDNVARWLADITRDNRVVMFNAGYDIGWLHADLKLPVPRLLDDASCAAFLIDENREDLSLDGCCAWRGVEGKNLEALKIAAVVYGFPARDAVANIARLPARYAGPYGEQDPASTLALMRNLRIDLAAQGLMQAYDTEMRLIPVIHAMRKVGIRIDIDRAVAFQQRLVERSDRVLADLSERLNLRVGMDEIRSHRWLVERFNTEKAPYNEREGKATFEREWMRRATHWLPRLVAEAKQCRDMADKFVGQFLLKFAHRGRIHASINQWLYEDGGTRSHRLSYADPPLQQAPSRPESFDGWPLTGDNATEYRNCFLPEEGELWFAPDYSQQEYRHIVADAEQLGLPKADIAGDMYRSDPKTDFHQIVVQLTGLPRRHAKDCNFAKSYGAGVRKFAAMTSKSEEDAAAIMDTYDRELPFVKQLSARCEQLAQARGWIKLFDGARCHFDLWEAAWLTPEERRRGYDEGYRMSACSRDEALARGQMDGHPWKGVRIKRAFTHKALNRRIQGNAARQMKLALVECAEAGHQPLITMHDELGFSLSDPKVGEAIVTIMRDCYQTPSGIPFLVDAEIGETWGSAKTPLEGLGGFREHRPGAAKRGKPGRGK